MSIAFEAVQVADVTGYISARLRLSHNRNGTATDDQAERDAAISENTKIVADCLARQQGRASGHGFRPATQAEAKEYDEDFLRRNGSVAYPVLEAEEIGATDLVVLTEDAFGRDAGEFALRMTTNMSVTYLLGPSQNEEVEVPEKMAPQKTALMSSASLTPSSMITSDTMKELAIGLAGNAPKKYATYAKVGVLLINMFWPNAKKPEEDWSALYAEIKKIVKEAQASKLIDDAFVDVSSALAELRDSYPTKTKYSDKDDILARRAAKLIDVTTSLAVSKILDDQTREIRMEALSNYVYAANVHLGILQERATIDKEAQGNIPEHSDGSETGIHPITPWTDYTSEIQNYVKTYSDHVTSTAKEFFDTRMAKISDVIRKNEVTCSGTDAKNQPVCSDTDYYHFEDKHTGYKSKKTKKKSTAESQLADYRSKEDYDLTEYLKTQFFDVTKMWQQISAYPFGVPIADDSPWQLTSGDEPRKGQVLAMDAGGAVLITSDQHSVYLNPYQIPDKYNWLVSWGTITQVVSSATVTDQVGLSGGDTLGLQAGGRIDWLTRSGGLARFTEVYNDSRVVQIAIDGMTGGQNLWLLLSNGTLTWSIFGSPTVGKGGDVKLPKLYQNPVAGQFASVSAAPDGTVWATDRDHVACRYDPDTRSFERVNSPKLARVCVGSHDRIWGLGMNCEAFRKQGEDWVQIPTEFDGDLTDLSVAGDGTVFGIRTIKESGVTNLLQYKPD
jgi:hypothetical protein